MGRSHNVMFFHHILDVPITFGDLPDMSSCSVTPIAVFCNCGRGRPINVLSTIAPARSSPIKYRSSVSITKDLRDRLIVPSLLYAKSMQ